MLRKYQHISLLWSGSVDYLLVTEFTEVLRLAVLLCLVSAGLLLWKYNKNKIRKNKIKIIINDKPLFYCLPFSPGPRFKVTQDISAVVRIITTNAVKYKHESWLNEY